jgi:hypothetical protein
MNQTHGHTSNGKRSKTFVAHQNMVSRCRDSSFPSSHRYKERGIRVCARWRRFINFLEDMGEKPEGKTLDRIDNHGNYEPSNCRWATRREQANNRITNIFFEYEGITYTLANLARFTGVHKDILTGRLCRSNLPWTVAGAVETPVIPRENRKDGFYA